MLDRPYAFKQWVEKYLDTIPGAPAGQWGVDPSLLQAGSSTAQRQRVRHARASQLATAPAATTSSQLEEKHIWLEYISMFGKKHMF